MTQFSENRLFPWHLLGCLKAHLFLFLGISVDFANHTLIFKLGIYIYIYIYMDLDFLHFGVNLGQIYIKQWRMQRVTTIMLHLLLFT
jgi:hypothetical protein